MNRKRTGVMAAQRAEGCRATYTATVLTAALGLFSAVGAAGQAPNTPPAPSAAPAPMAAPAPAVSPPAMLLSSQPGFSAPPKLPAFLPPQPSLGYSISPLKGKWGPHFAPFLEARLRWEERPARGFGELATTDPSAILGRLRPGALWYDRHDTALVQFQGAATAPLESSANVSNRHLDIHELFYTRSGLLGLQAVRLGRQELSYGNERMVGPANFSQPGRTWDGVRLVAGKPGRTVDAFYTHTVNFQIPQPMFYFSGLWGTWTAPRLGEVNLYALHKGNDHGVSLHRNTIGALWRWPATTSLDIELQENGQIGSEAGKDVGASSGRVVIAEKVGQPHLLGSLFHGLTLYQEGEYASGSGATGGDAGTFDQLFPTTHGKWGQIDYQGWRNMTELRVGASSQPGPRWLAGFDFYSFGLASAHDFWYRSNGAAFFTPKMQDRTKDYGTHTGDEVDLTATFKANSHINWQAALAQFYPGDFVKGVTGKSGASTFIYLQSTLTY